MKRIVLAGLAGLVAISVYLSITLQFVLHAATGLQLFQWDASNALGASAFAGGWETAALGLVMDVPVSVAWAAIYVLFLGRLGAVRQRPVVPGLLFGALVMIVMHWIVVPLGHAREGPAALVPLLNELVAHTAFFGVPGAVLANRFRKGT